MPKEEIFLDLKALSQRSCLSIRTLRYLVKNLDDPIPIHRVGQKILVWWPDFCAWMINKEQPRPTGPDTESMADELLESLK